MIRTAELPADYVPPVLNVADARVNALGIPQAPETALPVIAPDFGAVNDALRTRYAPNLPVSAVGDVVGLKTKGIVEEAKLSMDASWRDVGKIAVFKFQLLNDKALMAYAESGARRAYEMSLTNTDEETDED
jgi:hypothetical protein